MQPTGMNVSIEQWELTFGVLAAIILVDLVIQIFRKKEPSFIESLSLSLLFIALAVGFYFVVEQVWGSKFGNEYLAGYVTEKSLSIDNLFVFLIIFTKFKVPKPLQNQALIVGIFVALVLRFIFIAAGAAAITTISWIFYLFGAFLLYTAYKLVKDYFAKDGSESEPGGKVVALLRKRISITDDFHGNKISLKISGKRFFTPLLLTMITIGSADILFALDSIPAVFGITNEPYIVVVANAFALVGLRQLYFVLSGLLSRLKYLGLGLSVILGWIGLKLLLHALHKNELPFINGGLHVESIPEISTELSLGVILGTVVVATVLSLLATRKK